MTELDIINFLQKLISRRVASMSITTRTPRNPATIQKLVFAVVEDDGNHQLVVALENCGCVILPVTDLRISVMKFVSAGFPMDAGDLAYKLTLRLAEELLNQREQSPLLLTE